MAANFLQQSPAASRRTVGVTTFFQAGVAARFVQNRTLRQKYNKTMGFQKRLFVEGIAQNGGIRRLFFQKPFSECISKATVFRNTT